MSQEARSPARVYRCGCGRLFALLPLSKDAAVAVAECDCCNRQTWLVAA